MSIMVTHRAWVIPVGLAGCRLKAGKPGQLCPVLQMHGDSSDIAELLGCRRLAELGRGHTRSIFRASGEWNIAGTIDGNGVDFSKGLEINGATITLQLSEAEPSQVIFFRAVHGVIWRNCTFKTKRIIRSHGSDESKLQSATALSAFFYQCHRCLFHNCHFEQETEYVKELYPAGTVSVEKLTYQPGGGDGGDGGDGDDGGCGGGGAGGGGGGGLSWLVSNTDTSTKDLDWSFDDSEKIYLPWTGIVSIIFLGCDNPGIFNCSGKIEGKCTTDGVDAGCVTLGMYQCHSVPNKHIGMDGSCNVPGGVMAGRVGWRNASGLKKQGLRLALTARSRVYGCSAAKQEEAQAVVLNAQAICGGMRNCQYITPVGCSLVLDASAMVADVSDMDISGISIAEAYGFCEVDADLTSQDDYADSKASAWHTDKTRMAGGGCSGCSGGLECTGTDNFEIKNY